MRQTFLIRAIVAATATAVAAFLTGCAVAPPAAPVQSQAPGNSIEAVGTPPANVVKPKPTPKPNLTSDAAVGLKMEPSTDLSVFDSAVDLTKLDLTFKESGRELERGGASWYGPGFHGKRTANGERYDMHALTAAHKTLPFGTMVRVKSLVNGREVMVRITDRGPFIRNRIIDLSRAAAAELGMLSLGFKQVVLMVAEGEVVGKPPAVIKRRLGR